MIKVLKKASDLLNIALAVELKNQGHYLTGALERSIHGIVKENKDESSVEGYALSYAEALQEGVAANEFHDFHSHVRELTNYYKLRGYPEKMALKRAVITANKHFEEGMPTKSSYSYSKTGERMFFLNETDKRVGEDIDRVIQTGVDLEVKDIFLKTKNETI